MRAHTQNGSAPGLRAGEFNDLVSPRNRPRSFSLRTFSALKGAWPAPRGLECRRVRGQVGREGKFPKGLAQEVAARAACVHSDGRGGGHARRVGL